MTHTHAHGDSDTHIRTTHIHTYHALAHCTDLHTHTRTHTRTLLMPAPARARRQMTKVGMRRQERFLPVGAVVTCIGELVPNQVRTPPSSTPAGTAPHQPSQPPLPSHPHALHAAPPGGAGSSGADGGVGSRGGGRSGGSSISSSRSAGVSPGGSGGGSSSSSSNVSSSSSGGPEGSGGTGGGGGGGKGGHFSLDGGALLAGPLGVHLGLGGVGGSSQGGGGEGEASIRCVPRWPASLGGWETACPGCDRQRHVARLARPQPRPMACIHHPTPSAQNGACCGGDHGKFTPTPPPYVSIRVGQVRMWQAQMPENYQYRQIQTEMDAYSMCTHAILHG